MTQNKPKKCSICKNLFEPKNSMQKVCSIKCAIDYSASLKKNKEFRETLQRRENLKSRAEWLKEAQTAFNAYIRERDAGLPCISCQKPPKKKNAGHYLSTGSHPELRFEPLNVHLQCEHCNTYLSGNLIQYRKNLIVKIGIGDVEWLESKHEPKKYSIEEIKDIKKIYKDKLKSLKI